MLIVMKKDATQIQIDGVIEKIKSFNLTPVPIPGSQRTAVGIIGNAGPLDPSQFVTLDGVKEAIPVSKPYKLVSREFKPEDTRVMVGDVAIGGKEFTVIAGPCAVESLEQCLTIALAVKKSGAKLFRAGAFKPRTSPYSFQGLGEKGLEILAKVRNETGLFIVTEAIDHVNLALVEEVTDVIQIGTRNMQNFTLLKRAGKSPKPILLKRGMSATIEEFLMAAEYIASEGNPDIILCERGIRTFESSTRNTLDLSAVPLIKGCSNLPVIVDPSHGTGIRNLVAPMSKAAVACGADGLMIEVHHNPEEAFSDGAQSLLPDEFTKLAKELKKYLKLEGKVL